MHISSLVVQHSKLFVITAGIKVCGDKASRCLGLLISSMVIEL